MQHPNTEQAKTNEGIAAKGAENRQTPTEDKKEPSEKVEPGLKGWIIANEKWVNALSTGFIAVFTILLAFGTLALYCATRNLVSSAEKTAERQLRAYVSMASAAIQPQTNEAGISGLYIRVIVKNSGQTPARDFRIWIEALVSVPTASPFQFPDNLNARPFSVLGPGIETNLDKEGTISADDLADLHSSKKVVFVWARVEYRDIFDKPHYLKLKMVSSVWYPIEKRWGVKPLGEEGD